MDNPPASFSPSIPAKTQRARLCFDLPESLAHIIHLRKASRCYVESLGFSTADADDLEMLLGELSTNVVRHAKAGTYHVCLEFLTDRYILTVLDQGVGFVPDAIPEPGTSRFDTFSSTGEERIGGLGLTMIRAIADQVDIYPTDPQGTTVCVKKNLSNASTTLR